MTVFTSPDEKIEFLKSTDIFKPLSDETITNLAHSCEEIELNKGEFLFQEGEPGDSMFVVLSGELSIEKQNSVIAHRERGEHLGEMALIESGPRSASARALTKTIVLKIVKKQFQDHFATNPLTLMEVMKKISMRAREDLKALDEGMKIIDQHKKTNKGLQGLLNDTSNEIYIIDSQNLKFINMNSRALNNLGYEKAEMLGLEIFKVLKGLTPEGFEEHIKDLRSGQEEEILLNADYQKKDGSQYPVEVRLKLKKDEGPPVLVAFVQDISHLKKIETNLHNLSYYDSLTHLPNKLLTQEHLAFTLANASEKGNSVGLLLIGLDDVNLVDNSLGNNAGDLFLQAVAEILKKGLSPNHYLGRCSETGFIIVLSDVSFETEVAALARQLIKTFQTPLSINGEEIFPKLNIGISYYPLDGHDAETLIKKGDTAKDYAKAKGGTTYCHFSSEMGFEIKDKLFLERDLQKALENDEFELYYQPKLHLKSETITGFEALLRWNHPQRGLVPPLDFIPVAEKSNLIIPIGEWVLKTACRQFKTWLKMNFPLENIAVNLSPQQFKHPELVSDIAEIIVAAEIYPECLELEITETSVMENMETTLSTLKQLNGIGIKVSLDDFGTGYSSMSYLNDFPLNNLKIDRTFVKDISSEKDASMAKAIISLAKSFNLKVIAEGVATEEQKEVMRSIGCDFIQGYLLSKPLPADEATKLFSSP